MEFKKTAKGVIIILQLIHQKQALSPWYLRLSTVHRGIALFLTMILLSESVAATPEHQIRKVAQQPQTTSQDNASAAANRALAEAGQLLKQGTADSKKRAIEEYSEALHLWQQVGDRSKQALTLGNIGWVYYLLGEKQKSLGYYNLALSLYHAVGDVGGEATMLISSGGVYSDLGNKQKALDSYNQALPMLRSVGNRSILAKTLAAIGSVYKSLAEQQKALDYYNQALSIQKDLGDKESIADTLQSIGIMYGSLGNYPQAIDAFNQALPLMQAVGNRSEQADTLNLLAVLYISVGEKQKALDSLNQALSVLPAQENPISRALTLNARGGVYNALGDSQKALDSYNQALVLLRATGNPLGEAETLSNIGQVYDELGEPQKALESFNQALVIKRALKDPTGEATILNNIGGVYKSLGENQKALDSYNQALVLQRQVGERLGEATTITYIASVYNALSDYQLSLDSYSQALSMFTALGDRFREAQTLDSMAGVYRLLGDYQQALASSTQALSLWREQNNHFGEAATLTTIVRVYESLSNYQQAINSASQALSLFRAQGNRSGEAAAIGLMGRVYLTAGNYQRSLDSFNQALPIFHTLGSRLGEAQVLDKLGKVYEDLGDYQLALKSLNQGLSLWRVMGDTGGEAETLYSIASVERKQGNLNAALTQIEGTINIVEALRAKVTSQELRTSYFASVQKYYQFYIDLLMQLHKNNPTQGYNGKALQASERSRARSLLEILSEAGADIRQGVEPKLLERERTLQQQLNIKAERQQQLVNANDRGQVAAIQKEIDVLLRQYQEVEAQIRASSPRYAALTQPQPLTLSEIQKEVLDDNTLLLEYSLGNDRSYLWAVTPTSINSYELPGRATIESAVKQFRDLVTHPVLSNDSALVAKTAAPLSQILLAPVAQQLSQKRLVIVGDGVLQYVPFAALSNPATATEYEPLMVKHEIVNLPSASTQGISRRELKGRTPAPKTLAILADPVFTTNDPRINKTQESLPSTQRAAPTFLENYAKEAGVTLNRLKFTRNEAEAIKALVPENQRQEAFDFNASLAEATSPQLSQYRVVHFATHGILNLTHPELSGLVLSLVDKNGTSQNGFLRLNNIFNLTLPADLVVLSACKTGTGKVIQGEGIVGLTRGFMYAGAARIIASLWSVNDPATADLMTKFYQGYLKQGLTAAAALRAAQMQMWQEQKWQSPYYWAAFTLQGEWR